MTTQKDDSFLSQILDTEEQAKQRVEAAQAKGQKDLSQHEKELGAAREKALADAREKSKTRLGERQASAKAIYKSLLEEGEKEAATLKKSADARMEKVLPMAQAFLINDVL